MRLVNISFLGHRVLLSPITVIINIWLDRDNVTELRVARYALKGLIFSGIFTAEAQRTQRKSNLCLPLRGRQT
jgi:hypothetical protein